MVSKYKHKGLTWIDVEGPTRDEILHLMEEYALPELVGEELLEKSMRGKVDLYPHFAYLVLHFPIIGRSRDGVRYEQEIDFIVGKEFLITVHYEPVDPLHEFSRVFEVKSILDKRPMGDHAGYLLFYIMRELYKYSEAQLFEIEEDLKEIEQNIFENKEEKMVRVISNINRKLLDFKQAIRFHEHVLTSFESAGSHLFGEKFKHHLESITGEYRRVESIMASHKEILDDLKDTNDALLTSKTNETIKVLTIISFIMLPLTLITGVFGMNSDIVFISSFRDFLVVLGAMVLTGAVLIFYFRRKRWL
jgi:magnesium transporter